jgi:hypothetical protein
MFDIVEQEADHVGGKVVIQKPAVDFVDLGVIDEGNADLGGGDLLERQGMPCEDHDRPAIDANLALTVGDGDLVGGHLEFKILKVNAILRGKALRLAWLG